MPSDKPRTICPLRLAMDIIGGKWKLSIICLLEDGKPLRFNQIKRRIRGITNIMLAGSLKSFEEYGIIQREQYNEVPPRVEYRLAPGGFELLEVINMLNKWGNKYLAGHDGPSSHCPVCHLSSQAGAEAES